MSIDKTPTIVLIGLRGSGKSTLGKRLADAIARSFVDLDDRTAAVLGHATPGAALRAEGIDSFRVAEAQALEQAMKDSGCVLALGGGTPTAPGATDLLSEHRQSGRAMVMYLRAEPHELASRLVAAGAPDRPALVGDDPVSEIETLFEQRDPLYRELADGVLHCGSCDEDSAFAMLKAWAPA